MKILFISPEVFPFAKTGGLADIIGALPQALARNGHKCSVILPFYKSVKANKFSPNLFKKDIKLTLGNKEQPFSLYLLKQDNIDVYFIRKDEYYGRDFLYGTPQGDYPDNALRFGFFAKSVIASISHIGRQDILHCNDWQSSLIPLYVKLFNKKNKDLASSKILFTIHNMAYQGLFGKEVMEDIDIPEELFGADGLEFYGKLNFMKAGIIYSDAISTVSEGYSREILTPEFGCGLDGLLKTREKDVYGIVNGVDYSVWDPATDKFITKNYNKKDLSGKKECKKDVLKEFGIKFDEKKPLIGMITRLAEQKGIDLVADCMEKMFGLGVNFVLLGFGGKKYNNMFKEFSEKYKGKLGAKIDFDNALSHKIEAGCDMFLMPSRYEPCGLNQLYSLKYGTIPIVRAVGGLDDTIEDFNTSTKKGNGFKFKDATPEALLAAVKRAVSAFKDKEIWSRLLLNSLSCDFSWNASAERYEKLYNKLLKIGGF